VAENPETNFAGTNKGALFGHDRVQDRLRIGQIRVVK
jgi:hypothetical protein